MAQTVRMIAFGDDLIHKELYKAAENEEGSYCFDGMFTHVADEIKGADIAIINQETMLVPEHSMVSSFPNFGSPQEVGDAVAKAGFSVVTHASNHALDKGNSAILSTIKFWRTKYPDITVTGIHDSREDQKKIRVVERNGIKIAILNYTEKLNFKRVPSDTPYCIDVMKKKHKKIMREQIKKAKEKADFVLVMPHWGCEYLYEPIKSQKKWAHFFAECGADLIIGTHPHVIQPKEVIHTADGRDVPCIYSLGNYISCQIKQGTMLGGMADIRLERKADRVVVKKAEIVPLVTHTDKNYSYFTTYLLKDYNDELASENKIFRIVEKQYGATVNYKYLTDLFDKIMTGRAMEESELKTPMDVTMSNLRAVLNSMRGINTKK